MEITRIQISNPDPKIKKTADRMFWNGSQETEQIKGGQDTLTIGSGNLSSMPESQFLSMVKKQVLADVTRGASEYKLNDLQRQIALNEYDINPAEIVRRMTLESEM